jgi:hypothetical protein
MRFALLGWKGVSSVASVIDTQSAKRSLPAHSMLEPQRLQNFLVTVADEL